MVSNPSFSPHQQPQKSIEIEIAIDGPCELFHGCKLKYKGMRTFSEGGYCKSSGECHMVTFDGTEVSNYGTGVYDLVQSDHLNVQAYQYPCMLWNDAQSMCNGAIAINYGR
jgi:hypothetical protein